MLIGLLIILALPASITRSSKVNGNPSWLVTGRMRVARNGHTATVLPDGSVLVVGGYRRGKDGKDSYLVSAELYNPHTATWASAGRLQMARAFHQAILLHTGNVLIVGGVGPSHTNLASTELFSPQTRTWSATGSLQTGRAGFGIALLSNGTVLVAGGITESGKVLSNAEVYDPQVGRWTVTGFLRVARYGMTVTTLLNGKVLFTGGKDASNKVLTSAETYDPQTDMWEETEDMTAPRYLHTATLLSDGTVLVAGGIPLSLNALDRSKSSAEIFDPRLGIWKRTGAMMIDRSVHAAALLHNGSVLVVGGSCSGPIAPSCPAIISNAEMYYPRMRQWTFAGHLHTARLNPTIAVLPDGDVLVMGGIGDDDTTLASCEMYKS